MKQTVTRKKRSFLLSKRLKSLFRIFLTMRKYNAYFSYFEGTGTISLNESG